MISEKELPPARLVGDDIVIHFDDTHEDLFLSRTALRDLIKSHPDIKRMRDRIFEVTNGK